METLGTGARGPVVCLLQKALAAAGTYKDDIDGVFGVRTRAAVRAFQRKNGLTAEGVAGERTWRCLRPWIERIVRYTVQTGDTLSGIADAHGIGLSELVYANPAVGRNSRVFLGYPLVIPEPGSVINANIPYSFDVLLSDMTALRVRYPFLESGALGVSVLDSELAYLRFGRGEKRFLFNASHHANEWITTPLLMRFVERLCMAVVRDECVNGMPARQLFETHSLWAVPMVNPDGVDLATGAFPRDSEVCRAIYGKRGRPLTPQSWKANLRGVDLNNNYPALFEVGQAEKEASNVPGPRDYTGPYPLSEPETALLAAFTRATDPRLTVALHSQGREIYWRFQNLEPPNGLRIGKRMAEVSGYTLADPPGSSYGGYKDWFIQEFFRPGYTVEVGEGANPLPLDRFEEFYREVELILITGLMEG